MATAGSCIYGWICRSFEVDAVSDESLLSVRELIAWVILVIDEIRSLTPTTAIHMDRCRSDVTVRLYYLRRECLTIFCDILAIAIDCDFRQIANI